MSEETATVAHDAATGTATATVGDPPETNIGTSTLTVRNYKQSTVCYCGTTECYTRSTTDDHMLAIDTQLDVSVPSAKQDARRDIIVIVGKDAPFSVTYNCGGSTTGSIYAELR